MSQKALKSPKSEHFSEVSQKRAHSTFGPVHSTRSESRTSMLLGRHQNVGIGPIYPFNHRVTHDRQSKTEKAAERGILGQNGLSAEAPLPPKPLSMHLGHVPRRGNVYPDTLASTAMHGAWPQGPKSGSKDGGFSTIKLYPEKLGPQTAFGPQTQQLAVLGPSLSLGARRAHSPPPRERAAATVSSATARAQP